jgi:uncharacterized membrane protein YkvA (DUF1232 family)
MSETEKYLDTFPTWLRNLGQDAEGLAALIEEDGMPDAARESIAGGLNYLFKSLDLVPDGTDDIGYLDDAFVLRVAAELASREDTSGIDEERLQPMARLADDCDVVREFLAQDYERLENYTKGLTKGAARGRSVSDILGDEDTRKAFMSDVQSFARSYEPPEFQREEKNLIKLKSFFEAKLPK